MPSMPYSSIHILYNIGTTGTRHLFVPKNCIISAAHNRIIRVLLHNTYLSFQNQFYEHVEGAAMGFLVSPIVVNFYMEHFERKALSTATTPRLWMQYVDDTFVIQQEGYKQTFLEHINKVDPAIKFTVEGNKEWIYTIPWNLS